MREAINEYFDLCELSGKWMKKHWKGCLLVCTVIYLMIYLIEMIIFFPECIIKLRNLIVSKINKLKKWIHSKFKREKNEEVE